MHTVKLSDILAAQIQRINKIPCQKGIDFKI